MKAEPHETNDRLHQQEQGAELQVGGVGADHKWDEQKANRKRARQNRQPLDRIEEPVLRVIGQAEDEIADKSADREEQHPLRPFDGVRPNEAIDDEQQSESGVCQRSRERRRVGQTPNRPLVKELTVKVQDDARQTDGNCAPADEMSDVAPYGGDALAERQHDGQHRRRDDRKIQRHIFRFATEVILRMREKDVDNQAREVEKDEQLDPQLVV